MYLPSPEFFFQVDKNYNPSYLFLISQVKNDFHALSIEIQQNPPCTDSSDLAIYLNDPKVKEAIHVRQNLPTWTLCR